MTARRYDLEQRLEGYRQVVLRASTDAAFRAALKADPAQALRDTFGIEWDPSIAIEVIEETPTRQVLVLPAVGDLAMGPANDDELSDGDLDKVAAGTASQCRQPPCGIEKRG